MMKKNKQNNTVSAKTAKQIIEESGTNIMTFKCSLNKKNPNPNKIPQHVVVELDAYRKQALISDISVDNNSLMEFTILLKDMSIRLKEMGIDEIIQQIFTKEWEGGLKNVEEFTLVNHNTLHDFVNVSCKVELFPIAFMKGYIDL